MTHAQHTAALPRFAREPQCKAPRESRRGAQRKSQCGARFARTTRRAFSLLEAALASLLVGVLLIASMKTVGASIQTQYLAGERAQATLLVDALTAEVLSKYYEDPNGSVVFGPESDEQADRKSTFDDVDDFDGWSESPPQFADGTVMPDMTGWRRTVQLERIQGTPPYASIMSETGLKRVTIIVEHNGRETARRVGLRAKAP